MYFRGELFMAHLTVSMAPNFMTLLVAPEKYYMAPVENHWFRSSSGGL
jgi:hypothetical protein